MSGTRSRAKEFIEERVAFTADPKKNDRFIPRISLTKGIGENVEKSFRAFETDDVNRVLDFENVPDPPADGPLMHCENGNEFPSRHFALRGGFLLYFGLGDVSGTGRSHYVTYHGPPKGVIPIDKVKVEFPPGGRRVFREHAQTNARTGYEMAILHTDHVERPRPPAFIVADSLGQREKWAKAIMARSGIESYTALRAVSSFAQESSLVTNPAELLQQTISDEKKVSAKEENIDVAGKGSTKENKHRSTRKGKRGAGGVKEKNKNNAGDEISIQAVLKEFGKNNFSEKTWIDNYFETHSDVDASSRCRLMEKQQDAIKRGLKAAVLEQYEYFVEASGEMKKMGREVVDLKTLVETQVETIKEMKEIDFSSAILDPADDDNASDGVDLFHDQRTKGKPRRKKGNRQSGGDDDSDMSSVSSDDDDSLRPNRSSAPLSSAFGRSTIPEKVTIDIPTHLEDVAEEILAYVKESRYTDATDIWAKSKQEVNDIMQQHDKPTEEKLTKRQQNQVQILIEKLDELSEMISNRVVENLRRKNEAMKQASKRERSDPTAHMVPSVSPCCLNDDSVSLRLLVKLGKSQEAATAYAARRSLLLLESLHERPLTGTGNVDLVIYAAQLSQSFFSCLAGAIEGFLDLFLSSTPIPDKSPKDEMSFDENSINSNALNMRNLPAGALASIVLWCDFELTKFAAAFGGTRVLGNLALSPPPTHAISPKKGPRVLGQSSNKSNDNATISMSKDRQSAIEVAAQCIGQAFQYSAENLDAVGLPLSPRLAESLRKRLKGCEAEVAKRLDEKWKPIVIEWEVAMSDDDIPLDERM